MVKRLLNLVQKLILLLRLNYCQIPKYLQLVILINIIHLLIAIPSLAQAQIGDSSIENNASVVFDGKVLFQIREFGRFSAQERAAQINQTLINTIKDSNQINIDLVQIDEQITLQETNSKRHLLTVTQADVISAANPYNQAVLWKSQIQTALDKGIKQRTTSYQSKAFSIAFLVTLMAIAIHLSIQFIRSYSSRHIAKTSKKQTKSNSWHKLVIQWCQFVLLGFQLAIWICAFIYITNLFPRKNSGIKLRD